METKCNAKIEDVSKPNKKEKKPNKNGKYINKPKRQCHCNIKCILSEHSKWFEQQKKSIGLHFMRRNICIMNMAECTLNSKVLIQKHTDMHILHTQWTMNPNSRLERYIYLKVSTWFLIFEFCSCFACIYSLNSIRLDAIVISFV